MIIFNAVATHTSKLGIVLDRMWNNFVVVEAEIDFERVMILNESARKFWKDYEAEFEMFTSLK